MTTGIRDFSTTPGNNLDCGGISQAEGMARASVNNNMRARDAEIARLLLDLGGAIATTGSSNAYVLTLQTAPAALANNLLCIVKANFANTSTATINVGGLGAVAVKKIVAGVVSDLASGDIPSGHRMILIYSSGDSAWILLNPSASGSGFVSGPATSTDNAIARYDGSSGTAVQNSGVTVDDTGALNATGLYINNQAVLGTAITTKTTTYTAAITDAIIIADTSGGGWTLSLPAASTAAKKVYIIRHKTANTLTIDPNGAELINGSATYTSGIQETIIIFCDGTSWYS